MTQGVTSSQALANPYSRYITLDRDFVGVSALAGIIGDAPFVTRDRMGRDLAFLCRIYANGWSTSPRSISLDESGALLIEPNGMAYFLHAPGGPQVCADKTPLTYLNVGVNRIGTNGSFNLTTWSGTGSTAYTVSAIAGALSSTQPGGDIY